MALYRVISTPMYQELEGQVNKHLRLGWQPLGGVSVLQKQGTSTLLFFQAMIYENEKENKKKGERNESIQKTH